MRDRLARIRLAAFDVDGVLTDGGVVLGDSDEAKQFHTQDGLGLKALMRAGVEVAIITARRSRAVERRAAELGIDLVFQGVRPKLPLLRAMAAELGLSPAEVLYMGDDLPDAECLEWAGVGVAPSNARPEAKARALVLLRGAGGGDAVREIADRVAAARAWARRCPPCRPGR